MSFTYYEDPILGKGRAQVDNGSGGSGGSSYVGGDRINIAGGTISFVNSADIVNVVGTSVTLQPDTAYKIYATSQAITLNANPPASGKWAYEGHLEIFTAGTGYVVTGSNVVLANALEPDAVNNCTVRFHDGISIISVEDHIAGYIVVSATGTSAGSLYYGLGSASEQYIAVDASLNGQVLDLGGVVTSAGEKHLVGNGYSETVVSGGISCSSKTTFANLAANNVVVSSGTLTLGDVYIPSGATVAVSGGRLAVEKVTGAGSDSVIDLGGTNVVQATQFNISGLVLTSGIATADAGGNIQGGAVKIVRTNATISDTVFDGNTASNGLGGAIFYIGSVSDAVTLDGCTFKNNTATIGAAICCAGTSNFTIKDCTFASGQSVVFAFSTSGFISLAGTYKSVDRLYNAGGNGTVTISSGAIVDLTGNTNPTPITPGGGVIVDGGCIVINSAGASVSIAGGTYTQINNDGTTE